jgi:rhamnogalacturonyl hydrolase YesR
MSTKNSADRKSALDEPAGRTELEEQEAALKQVLADFRCSVHAWSDSAMSRPRPVSSAAPHRIWRRALGWALGCVLVAGGVSGSIYERHHQQELARIAAVRQAQQQRLAAEQRAREEEDLLAKVDSDVSREVPSAMEPLARLMAEGETR